MATYFVGNVQGFWFNSSLQGEMRSSVTKHFEGLLLKLQRTRKRHLKELKQLSKIKKTKETDSLARIRKMSAVVSPEPPRDRGLHNEIALEDLDGERNYQEKEVGDSIV